MHVSRLLQVMFLTVALACSAVAHAGIITLDLCPAGTNNNVNVYGVVLTGGSANWSGASFRDYKFNLSTTSGTASFDEFSILLSAQLRQATSAYGNTLRASLWSGAIVSNPLLANALTTISVSNNAITASGFSAKVSLTGSPFTSQTISTTPSEFFVRVWAEGTINDGYQTKMATSHGQMMAITMQRTVPISGTIDIDTDNNGTFDLVDPMSIVVPEIDPAGMASVLALVTGVLGLVERRRITMA